MKKTSDDRNELTRNSKEVLEVSSNSIYDKKHISLALSIVFSIAILYCICLFIYYKFNQFDKLDLSAINRIFAVPLPFFVAERVEKIQFFTSVAIFPILVFLLNFIFLRYVDFSRYSPKRIKGFFYNISFILVFLFIGDNILNDFLYELKTNYFGKPILEMVLLGFVFLLLYFEISIMRTNIRAFKYYTFILDAISSFTILTVFLISVISIYSIDNNGDYYIHLSAYFDSVVQVYMGKALLVDFVNQYGLYPHFIEPIFRIIGLSIFKFTLIMGLLLSLSFLFIYLFIRDIAKSRIIGLIGFTTVVWFSFLFAKTLFIRPYFQYFPNRVLFPCLLIYLTWIYFKSENKKIIYYSSFIIYSIGILWNTDSGIPVFASWLLVLIYTELYKDIKVCAKNSLVHLIKGLSILSFVVLSYALYIKFRYGTFPNFGAQFDYIKLFYNYGYYMIKMNLFDLWNFVALIYMIGIGISAQALITKNDTIRTRMIFLLSVLGVGIFSYYQGRSHFLNLLAVCYPALILVTIYVDDLFQMVMCNFKKVREKNISIFKFIMLNKGLLALFIFLMFMLSSSLFSIFYNYNDYYEFFKNNYQATLKKQPTEFVLAANFIKKYTRPHEKVMILSYNSGVYYLESSTISALDMPGTAELCLKSDFTKIEERILSCKERQIFLDNNFLEGNFDDAYKSRIEKALNNYYRIDSASQEKNNYKIFRYVLKN